MLFIVIVIYVVLRFLLLLIERIMLESCFYILNNFCYIMYSLEISSVLSMWDNLICEFVFYDYSEEWFFILVKYYLWKYVIFKMR